MTAPRALTKRQVAKEATRKMLMAAAHRMFTRYGYDAAGLRDIAQAALLSTGSVFLHWPGKAALWRDVMGYEPPTADAFARFVASAASLEQAQAGARLFLQHLNGCADRGHGAVWRNVANQPIRPPHERPTDNAEPQANGRTR